MFYDLQAKELQEKYKQMLTIMGQLSNLFSDNKCPYLAYRAHENIFCKYLEAINVARADCSADAKKGCIGIGLKTWVGTDDQKIAEFGKLKSSYANLSGKKLVKRISEYRNERIRVTKKKYGVDRMIYHVVKRVPGAMQILECTFDPIDIGNIRMLSGKGKDNNTYFTDGKHEYHFSVSKNTLYMNFADLELLDEFEVPILNDPYTLLRSLFASEKDICSGKVDYLVVARDMQLEVETNVKSMTQSKLQLCLPLYSKKKGVKYIGEKSGLNQWNASGRVRNENEIYIPYNALDRNRCLDFFPPRDMPFTLHLPDGTEISAKVCQGADRTNPKLGKAIMSNPNKVLGKWLLRDVFELPEKTVITYDMLEKFGVDSVVFTKNREGDYSIDFSEIGTYEEFYGEGE